MLGRFLEFSVATADIRASLAFYERLGFSHAKVGEAWDHPYAVMTDGRLCVGLHESTKFAPSITFVKADLLKHLNELERLRLAFKFRRLTSDEFNEIGWLDPSGYLVRLVEARTFSPSKRKSFDSSTCGYFVEIALPAPDLESAKVNWERFGFVGMNESEGALEHVACTSDTLDIGLYRPEHLGDAALLFEVDDLDAAVGRLEAAEVPVTRAPAAFKRMPGAMLRAPEGTRLILLGKPGR